MPDLSKVFPAVIALGRMGLPDYVGPVIASLLGEDNYWITAEPIELSDGQVKRSTREGSHGSPLLV